MINMRYNLCIGGDKLYIFIWKYITFVQGGKYMNKKQLITDGKAVIGIEFGSTRIKAVLVGENAQVLATGAHDWENQLVNGIWTYSLDQIWKGLQDCYADLAQQVRQQYDITLTRVAAIGISGMMHGYLPFDKDGELLTPFRTWRNTITQEAAEKLTREFDFNIPQRWSIAHLYQAILNKEEHVSRIDYITTLAGYIHWKLTGKKVLGIGEASGMFPIDSKTKDYNARMLEQFNSLDEVAACPWKLQQILPQVLLAGDEAGILTAEGAGLLDVSGNLQAQIPFCPPEGDAGTGMTATNSVAVRTGNVSAGTSVFAMVVLEKELQKVHEELDLVTTPSGDTVAMVHCNNCTSDLNKWIGLFKEFSDLFGMQIPINDIYEKLYTNAMNGAKDCDGIIAFNTLSGEPVIGTNEGRPMVFHKPDAKVNLANFMRAHLYASLATLKVGCDILFKEEQVAVDRIYGHGGLFKTKGVGQNILAAAMNAPVALMSTAGEGGPWGMAILASYMLCRDTYPTLQQYLNQCIFANETATTVDPDPDDVRGFDAYIANYRRAVSVQQAAIEALSLS